MPDINDYIINSANKDKSPEIIWIGNKHYRDGVKTQPKNPPAKRTHTDR